MTLEMLIGLSGSKPQSMDNTKGMSLDPTSPISQCIGQKLLKITFPTYSALPYSRTSSCADLRNRQELENNEGMDCDYSELENQDCELEISLESPVEKNNENSMDLVLQALWDSCVDKGLFNYDLKTCHSKIISAMNYKFIIQLNEGRATKKRPTEFSVDKVVQDFDDSKFNFTKAKMEEVLFQFGSNSDSSCHLFEEEALITGNPHLVCINTSPIEYGHVLLLPNILKKFPQLITKDAILLAIQFAAASDNPYFRVGYNSLGAYATVNHLHFHAYYLMAPFPLEKAPTMEIARLCPEKHPGVKISIVRQYPVNIWVFEMAPQSARPMEDLALAISDFCTVMQKRNIPHNLLVSKRGSKIFLWPQNFAQKKVEGKVSEEILATEVNPAVFEIAGHIILKKEADYRNVNYNSVWELLAMASLSDEEFKFLTDSLIT